MTPERTSRTGTARTVLIGAAAASLLFSLPDVARAQAAPAPEPLPSDPVLARLIKETLDVRPELKQAEATVRAEQQRVPQAGALPDPVLSLGIQNDGFDEIMIGEMETSFWEIGLSQGIPWPGKRGLRTDVARLSARQVDANTERVRLTTEAEVRRAYVDLLLARDRLALLDQLDAIWARSAGIARTRYESGQGAQSDVLRTQLEVNRLRQRRWALAAQEKSSVQTLNRLRAHPLDEPIATAASIRTLGVPQLPPLEAAIDDAIARSPELAAARLGVRRSSAQLDLARRERFPDFSVSAGIMPRGGLDPMWQAGIAVNLPIWSYRKQNRAVEENEARQAAESASADTTEQVLRLRVADRHVALATALDTVQLYASGLLVQSKATMESTLAQYQVASVTFASVLEANAGYIADEEGHLASVADAQRIAIANAEVSLDPVALPGGGSAGAPMPGVGAAGGGSARASSAGASAGGSASAPAASGGSSSMSSGM
jgi:outer membrane protein, heavy metal efflux system